MLSAAEITSMTATVSGSLDVQVTITRNVAPSQDSYGHRTGAYTTTSAAMVNVIRPTDTQLQQFAGIIGSQRALLIRYMPTTDIRQGDLISYSGLSWKVSEILIAESYTVTNDALITTIA